MCFIGTIKTELKFQESSTGRGIDGLERREGGRSSGEMKKNVLIFFSRRRTCLQIKSRQKEKYV